MPTNPNGIKLFVLWAEQHKARWHQGTIRVCTPSNLSTELVSPKGTSECCLFTVPFLRQPNQFRMLHFILPKWLEWQAINRGFIPEKRAWERVVTETEGSRGINDPSSYPGSKIRKRKNTCEASWLGWIHFKTHTQNWRVKNADCSSRGPGFNSQHPHGGSQTSVTPVPENPTPSRDTPFCPLWAPGTHVIHRHVCKTPIHIR